MKKLVFLVLVGALLVSACKKSEEDEYEQNYEELQTDISHPLT